MEVSALDRFNELRLIGDPWLLIIGICITLKVRETPAVRTMMNIIVVDGPVDGIERKVL